MKFSIEWTGTMAAEAYKDLAAALEKEFAKAAPGPLCLRCHTPMTPIEVTLESRPDAAPLRGQWCGACGAFAEERADERGTDAR